MNPLSLGRTCHCVSFLFTHDGSELSVFPILDSLDSFERFRYSIYPCANAVSEGGRHRESPLPQTAMMSIWCYDSKWLRSGNAPAVSTQSHF